MREIIFRGKHKGDGGWVYGVPIQCYDGDWQICNDAYKYTVNPQTIGQYTGLTDKNGKKIFEGDVVKCKHKIQLYDFNRNDKCKARPRRSYGHELEYSPYTESEDEPIALVYYRNYQVVYRDGLLHLINGSDLYKLNSNYIYWHEIEIIGNVHDNPELLN